MVVRKVTPTVVMQDHFRLLGVYVPPSLYDNFADHLYAEAGATDLETYFDSEQATVPRGDPVAEVTHRFLSTVVDEFATLYDVCEFDTARDIDPDAYRLLHLAATPHVTVQARELFRAAKRIQGCDLRVIHTAILTAAIDEYGLPALPEEAIRADRG